MRCEDQEEQRNMVASVESHMKIDGNIVNREEMRIPHRRNKSHAIEIFVIF